MRPRPENFATRAEYRWASKQYNRRHGGSMAGSIALAVFFGAATGSPALLLALVAFSVGALLVARAERGPGRPRPAMSALRARRAGLRWSCQKHGHAMARATQTCPIDNSPCGYYPKETKR